MKDVYNHILLIPTVMAVVKVPIVLLIMIFSNVLAVNTCPFFVFVSFLNIILNPIIILKKILLSALKAMLRSNLLTTGNYLLLVSERYHLKKDQ